MEAKPKWNEVTRENKRTEDGDQPVDKSGRRCGASLVGSARSSDRKSQ
jgi:hypothetical protein